MENLLYEVESVRRFVGLRLTGALPDETTILNFRHLLEKHGLGEALFGEINAHLAYLGHRLKTGTIVDASLIEAPPSTKNRERSRDPEMHQAKKGNQVAFWDKGAHRRGFGVGFGAQHGHHDGERIGRDAVAPSAAWWRCGLGCADIWSRTACWRRRSDARRRSTPLAVLSIGETVVGSEAQGIRQSTQGEAEASPAARADRQQPRRCAAPVDDGPDAQVPHDRHRESECAWDEGQSPAGVVGQALVV